MQEGQRRRQTQDETNINRTITNTKTKTITKKGRTTKPNNNVKTKTTTENNDRDKGRDKDKRPPSKTKTNGGLSFHVTELFKNSSVSSSRHNYATTTKQDENEENGSHNGTFEKFRCVNRFLPAPWSIFFEFALVIVFFL
jgi:hypothetical protein